MSIAPPAGRRFRAAPAGQTWRVPTTDPRGVAWSVELRSSGRVCANIRRGRAWAYAAFSALMSTVVAAGVVVSGGGGRGFLAVLLVLMAPTIGLFAKQALRVGSWASPQVLVDATGLAVRHGAVQVPWEHLYGAVAYTSNHNRMISIVTSDEIYDAWLARRPALLRLLGRRWRRGPARLDLPHNLDVDTEAFAAWLTEECFDRLRAEAARPTSADPDPQP